MTFDSIVGLLTKLLDVLLVWLVLYYILKNLRKNVKMILLFKGILILVALKIISDVFNLVTVGYLIDYFIIKYNVAFPVSKCECNSKRHKYQHCIVIIRIMHHCSVYDYKWKARNLRNIKCITHCLCKINPAYFIAELIA